MINSAKNTNSSAHCERKFEILIYQNEDLDWNVKNYHEKIVNFGYYEKATKFEKFFHLKFDVTE